MPPRSCSRIGSPRPAKPSVSCSGWSGKVVSRRDHPAVERGRGGEDLHDRAGHVSALAVARQQRLGRVGAQGVHRRLRDLRVAGDRRRVEGRRRDHGQHGPGRRVERHDGARVAAELGRREVLEPPVDGERQVARLRLAVQDVTDEVADRVRIGLPDQEVLVGALEAGRAEAVAGVADDVGEGRVGIGAQAEAIDDLRAGQRRSGRASKIVPRGRLRRAAMTSGLSGRTASCCASTTCHQVDAAGDDREAEHQVQAQPPDVGGDHGRHLASAADRRSCG